MGMDRVCGNVIMVATWMLCGNGWRDALWEWIEFAGTLSWLGHGCSAGLDRVCGNVIMVGYHGWKIAFSKKGPITPPPPAPPRPSLSAGPGFSWPDKAKSVGSVTQPLPTTTTTTTTNNNNNNNKKKQQPTTNNQQPTANSQQPTANNQQPTTNNQQQQPTTNNQQQQQQRRREGCVALAFISFIQTPAHLNLLCGIRE